ncbi:MAG: family 16 glycosylhydrolase [Granulosicoccus sp.]
MRSVIVAVFTCLFVFSLPAFADSKRPSKVSSVSAKGTSGAAIVVSWKKPSDNVGVDGYNIYRDGDYFKTVGKITKYTDKSVKENREYSYAIVAFDRARNYSVKSSSAKAKSGSGNSNAGSDPVAQNSTSTTATGKPNAPGNVKSSVLSSSSAEITWSAPSGGAEGYNVYKNGDYYKTVKGSRKYKATSLNSSTSYTFSVVAFRNNKYSKKSANVSVRTGGGATTTTTTTTSTTPSPPPPVSSGTPAPPANFKASVENGTSAKLSWNEPSGGAEGYNVYQNGDYLKTVKGRRNYTVESLRSNRNYSFQVVAFRNNRFSRKSSTITVRTGDGSSVTTNNPSPPPPSGNSDDSAVPDGYKMVFNDEFNSRGINSSKWNTRYRWGADWIINNEKQYYIDTLDDPDFGATPFRHNDGKLTIQATKTPSRLRDKAKNQPYLSGAMTTHKKFKMKYGYVEIRARLPKGKGLWPAFWLLHESNDKRKPEIDVMEMLGDNTRVVYQTYHYYDNSTLRSTPSFKAPGPDYSREFHTFGMLWEKGSITWYVDGTKTNRYKNSKVSDESMYLLMNLALGGSWAGNPDSSTQFPAKFEIDYVRAYQKR